MRSYYLRWAILIGLIGLFILIVYWAITLAMAEAGVAGANVVGNIIPTITPRGP